MTFCRRHCHHISCLEHLMHSSSHWPTWFFLLASLQFVVSFTARAILASVRLSATENISSLSENQRSVGPYGIWYRLNSLTLSPVTLAVVHSVAAIQVSLLFSNVACCPVAFTPVHKLVTLCLELSFPK